jgi:hypothetical protein
LNLTSWFSAPSKPPNTVILSIFSIASSSTQLLMLTPLATFNGLYGQLVPLICVSLLIGRVPLP